MCNSVEISEKAHSQLNHNTHSPYIHTTLSKYIHEGLNTPKSAYKTVLVTIDTSKVFDTVPRTLLIQKTFNTDIYTHTKK